MRGEGTPAGRVSVCGSAFIARLDDSTLARCLTPEPFRNVSFKAWIKHPDVIEMHVSAERMNQDVIYPTFPQVPFIVGNPAMLPYYEHSLEQLIDHFQVRVGDLLIRLILKISWTKPLRGPNLWAL